MYTHNAITNIIILCRYTIIIIITIHNKNKIIVKINIGFRYKLSLRQS